MGINRIAYGTLGEEILADEIISSFFSSKYMLTK